ncbi:MAG: crotonase/enoyl-CoA hydratase family protein [Rhizobiaceae bacterium]
MALVEYAESDGVAVLTLNRAGKRNAISDTMMAELSLAVDRAAAGGAKAAVIRANGDHFCAGLDLAEQSGKDLMQGIAGSRAWHGVFTKMQRGSVPYVAALKGAVIGGGLELAAAAHIRVAEPDTFFAMPEGQRGIFVGGGGSVNITRLMGVARMTDMMLTGRTYQARDVERFGAVNYIAEAGLGFDKAMELALTIAGNAPLSNYVTINALQRIHDSGYDEGLFFETMIASLTQTTPEAVERMRAFVEKRAERLNIPTGEATE